MTPTESLLCDMRDLWVRGMTDSASNAYWVGRIDQALGISAANTIAALDALAGRTDDDVDQADDQADDQTYPDSPRFAIRYFGEDDDEPAADAIRTDDGDDPDWMVREMQRGIGRDITPMRVSDEFVPADTGDDDSVEPAVGLDDADDPPTIPPFAGVADLTAVVIAEVAGLDDDEGDVEVEAVGAPHLRGSQRAILEVLKNADGPLRSSQIAERASLGDSTVYREIMALVKTGHVRRNVEASGFTYQVIVSPSGSAA